MRALWSHHLFIQLASQNSVFPSSCVTCHQKQLETHFFPIIHDNWYMNERQHISVIINLALYMQNPIQCSFFIQSCWQYWSADGHFSHCINEKMTLRNSLLGSVSLCLKSKSIFIPKKLNSTTYINYAYICVILQLVMEQNTELCRVLQFHPNSGIVFSPLASVSPPIVAHTFSSTSL